MMFSHEASPLEEPNHNKLCKDGTFTEPNWKGKFIKFIQK